VQSEQSGSGTDLAELAARFSAHGGGHISPELSTDLALEVMLNEIVEQACLATGAIGAAIVLWRNGELVCRASSGATAPELGSRVNPEQGIVGECVQSQRTQRCDDVLPDSSASPDSPIRMGVRSVMAMPILRDANLLGVFELFSGRAYAFGDRDERTLEALVSRTLANLDRASQPLVMAEPQSLPETTPQPASYAELRAIAEPISGEHMDEITTIETEVEKPSGGGPDSITLLLGVAVLVCAVMLGVLVGRHFGLQPGAHARPSQAANAMRTSGAANASQGISTNSAPAAPASDAATSAAAQSSPSSSGNSGASAGANSANKKSTLELTVASTNNKPAESAAPAGGLAVFQNGREIYRLRQGQAQPQIQTPVTPAAERGPVDAPAQAPAQKSPVPQSPAPQSPAANPQQNQTNDKPAAAPQTEQVLELPPSEVEQSLVVRIEPEYPTAALQQNIQGAVVLKVRIAADGAVQDVHPTSGPPQLIDAATDAVKQWKFRPRQVNGSPVPMQTEVTLNFTLHQ
jgi:TonB family protein